MEIKISPDIFFVFDLDDTLFKEIDFVRSGFRNIARRLKPALGKDIYEDIWRQYKAGNNAFQWIIDQYPHAIPDNGMGWILEEYRAHIPDIILGEITSAFLYRLKELSVPAGLITDGRSITQRNKLKALAIEEYFSDIIISEEFGSEKPDARNYLYFQEKYPGRTFYFIGDNTSKDFIAPARLGWRTICMRDDGNNIHAQQYNKEPLPDFIISSFKEIVFY